MPIARPLAALIARIRSDRRGNVLIMMAFASAALCASLALAVDYGSVYYAKRKAQSAVDMAAMAGAQSLATASTVARDSLSRNGYASPTELTVEVGQYTASRTVAVASRFVAGAVPSNAVRITMATDTPLFFGRSISGRETVALQASAVAATSQMAKFSIGSRLLSVDQGIANAALSRILGSTVSLSAMDYEALVGAKVDVFQFSTALASQLNMQAATFGELAAASMSVGDVYNALVTVGRSGAIGSTSTAAVESLTVLPGTSSVSLALGKLVDYGPYAPQAVADAPAASANVGLMDLIMAAAMVGNGTRQIAIDLGASIPGLASVTAYVSVGEHTVESPWLSLGDSDTVVRTAQTRVLIDARVGGTGVLAGASIALPIYAEVAASQARLGTITCGRDGTAGTAVALAVQPGLANLWLGTLSTAAMSNFAAAPTVSPATMVSLSDVTVTGSSQVNGASTAEQTVTFSKAEIDALTVKTVTSSGTSSALVGSLLGNNLSLDVNIVGLGLGLGTDAIRSAVGSSLTPALTPVDTLLTSILALTGVRLGQADVVVNGLRCDGAVLVQ